jgi:hypothetical protein
MATPIERKLNEQYNLSLDKMFKELAAAGTRPGYDPVFRTKTPSQRDVLTKWATVFQAITVIAGKHGLDLMDPTNKLIETLPPEKSEAEGLLG